MMFYMGIDPGKDGAMAWISRDGEVEILPFSESGYASILCQMRGKAVVALEKVGARPGQGTKSMFTFGENYGFIRGILEAFSIPYQEITPQKWKKEFSVTSDKKTSINAAKHLFPYADLRKTERSTKDHDGMAEALLLAEYCRRHMK